MKYCDCCLGNRFHHDCDEKLREYDYICTICDGTGIFTQKQPIILDDNPLSLVSYLEDPKYRCQAKLFDCSEKRCWCGEIHNPHPIGDVI